MTAFGFWKVTTEGDADGRKTIQLGVHEGYLDEIAFTLVRCAGYTLHFELVEPTDPLWSSQVLTDKVSVSVAGLRGSIQELLAGRPVRLEGTHDRGATLHRTITTEQRSRYEAERKKALAAAARAKLSDAELEALGLKR